MQGLPMHADTLQEHLKKFRRTQIINIVLYFCVLVQAIVLICQSYTLDKARAAIAAATQVCDPTNTTFNYSAKGVQIYDSYDKHTYTGRRI
jgi:hypothetical protein